MHRSIDECKTVSEIASDLEIIVSDCKEYMDIPSMGRLHLVYKFVCKLDDFHQAAFHRQQGLLQQLLRETTQHKLVWAFSEARRFIYTHQWLDSKYKDRMYYKCLTKGRFPVIGINDSSSMEDSTLSNKYYQYFFAALLSHAGFKVSSIEKTHDIAANDGHYNIVAECKRVSSKNQLRNSASYANRQLRKSDAFRIAFIDVSNIIYDDSMFNVCWTPDEIAFIIRRKMSPLRHRLKNNKHVDMFVLDALVPYAQHEYGPSAIAERFVIHNIQITNEAHSVLGRLSISNY